MSDILLDFGKEKDGYEWRIVNDGVMGGLSRGKVSFDENSLIFSGRVSLENNGGFTSFRSPYKRFDLRASESIEIRYRSEGLDCAFQLNQNQRFWRPNHKVKLPVTDNEWKVVKMALTEMDEYQMGQKTGNKMSESAIRNTIRLGLITDSKKAGSFKIEIDYIKFSN